MTSMVEIINEAGYAVDDARLQTAAATTLAQQQAPAGATLTIVVTSDEEVTTLNRTYRSIDAPTDILSFPADVPPVDPAGSADEAAYLGDLVIAYPYATAQAAREGHDLTHSLMLLVVHGTLHLLGYDHDTPARRAEMWAAQEHALQALNIPLAIVPALENYDDEHE